MADRTRSYKKWSVMGASIVLTVFLFLVILVLGGWHISSVKDFYLYETPEPAYSSFHMILSGPNYFFPVAKVSASLINSYADEIRGFRFFMSLDNSSWVEIPLSKTANFTELGKTSSNVVSFQVFTKWIFPSQTNTSVPISINTFKYDLLLEPSMTPQTVVITILLVIALFSFILKILEFIFLTK